MQTIHDTETQFGTLPLGGVFRFPHGGEMVIGLKAGFDGGGQAALVLARTKIGWTPGDLLHPDQVGPKVIPMPDAAIVPNTRADAVTPGAGYFAESAELELRHGKLIFVTQPQGGLLKRVCLTTGVIGGADGERPTEIYSEWAVVRGYGTDQADVLYAHKPEPKAA